MAELNVDGTVFTGLTGNSPAFLPTGGRYLIAIIATTWTSGSAALWFLGPDGATYVSVSTNLSNNGGYVLDLPKGKYQVQHTGSFVGGAVSITRVPLS